MSPMGFAPGRVIGTPSAPVRRTAANTGIPVGAAGDTRTPLSGGKAGMPVLNGLNITAANQVWDGYHITGVVYNYLNNSNATFRRCYFDLGYQNGVGAFNANGRTWGNLLIEDCEYNGQGPTNAGASGPFGNLSNQAFIGMVQSVDTDRVVVRRCDIHNGCDGLDAFGPGLTVDSCYIHDNAYYWVTSDSSTATHSDGVQLHLTGAGSLHDIKIINNTIDGSGTPKLNACIQMGEFYSNQTFVDIEISGNYFNGTSFNAIHGAAPLAGTMTRCSIHDNRYGLAFKGATGIIIPSVKESVMWGSGNVWDVSGTTVGGLTAVAGQPV